MQPCDRSGTSSEPPDIVLPGGSSSMTGSAVSAPSGWVLPTLSEESSIDLGGGSLGTAAERHGTATFNTEGIYPLPDSGSENIMRSPYRPLPLVIFDASSHAPLHLNDVELGTAEPLSPSAGQRATGLGEMSDSTTGASRQPQSIWSRIKASRLASASSLVAPRDSANSANGDKWRSGPDSDQQGCKANLPIKGGFELEVSGPLSPKLISGQRIRPESPLKRLQATETAQNLERYSVLQTMASTR